MLLGASVTGLICLRTHASEPGFEWREDIARLVVATRAVSLRCVHDQIPILSMTRAVTEQIVTRSQAQGHISFRSGGDPWPKGEHLSEMGDLRDAGLRGRIDW